MNGPRHVTRREAIAAAGAGVAAFGLGGPALASRRRSRSRVLLLPDARAVAARGLHPADLGLLEASALLQARRISATELTLACLDRAERRMPGLNAWIRIYRETALRQAAIADGRLTAASVRRHGRRAPLVCGVPLGLKDIYAAAGQPLTAGSKILAGNVAVADARAYDRLRYAGMVLIGHTQTHEFAAGNFTPQSANPWDPDRTPGGSSGGSAIALATRMVPAATGTDTLGSLRIPAGLCGVTALKPTRGLVPTTGVIPLAPSFDHAGPMARSAGDAALLLSQMVGNRLYLERPGRGAKPLAGVRVGVPTGSFGGVAVDAGIAARVAAFGRELASLGATLVSFPAPRSRADNLSGVEGFRFFLTGPGKEIDSYHRQWFPQRAAEYTNDVALTLTLIRAANTVPSDASNVRTIVDELARDWRAAFANARIHMVLQPAAVIPAPLRQLAAARTQSVGDAMVVWDYVGWPVICLPAGQDSNGLPVGVQLVGLPETEPALCRTAITAQAHFPHHEERPPGV